MRVVVAESKCPWKRRLGVKSQEMEEGELPTQEKGRSRYAILRVSESRILTGEDQGGGRGQQ